jgi:YD repeat-containing protein
MHFQTSPDTGTTRFGYDAAGNRIRQTDARGVTVQYSYDALNRLQGIIYPDITQNVSFTYDDAQGSANAAGAGGAGAATCANGSGRLCTMADASGSTD